MSKKILFLSHNAFRSGAQLLLLELLKYFNEHSVFEFEILFKDGGELINEFEKIAPINIWNGSFKNSWLNSKFRDRLHKSRILSHVMKQRFDLIYNNSFTNGSLLEELNILNKPVITHVHELSYWIERSGEKNLYYIKKFTSKYIAVSEAVKTYLNKCNITDQKIQIIHEFTNVDRMTACQEEKGLRKLLKLPDSCLVIGACGTEFWRKGKDLFIPLAIRTLKHTDKEVHFVWIGGQMDFELQFDLENSGYNKRIHFINHLPDASRYFNDFDIFLMLSREDPFPIVNLEVGALAKPILCFNNSGGTIELLSAINGLVSDYLDIDGMSDKIIGLVNDEKKRFEIGKILQEKIRNHFNINIVASMIEELIKQN